MSSVMFFFNILMFYIKRSLFFGRYVYWTDWGDKPYVGRVGMDGKNKTVIISTKLEWPNGLTIDYTNDKLYWADAHLNYIEYVHRRIKQLGNCSYNIYSPWHR